MRAETQDWRALSEAASREQDPENSFSWWKNLTAPCFAVSWKPNGDPPQISSTTLLRHAIL